VLFAASWLVALLAPRELLVSAGSPLAIDVGRIIDSVSEIA